MQTDTDSALQEQATRLFRSRMVGAALSHLEGMDIRTAVALELGGVIERNHEVVLENDVVEIVVDPNHPLRNKSSPGPILFYRNKNQEKGQYALDMTEVLLSDHPPSRLAAFKHFRHLGTLSHFVTSRSLLLFDQCMENELMSSDLKIWQTVALKLYDAVRADLLCLIAGARQSIEERYEDGIQRYFPKVLAPDLNTVDALEVKVLKPGNQRETGAALVEQIVDAASSFDMACTEYLDEVGFLPLDGTSSFSSLVKQWIARRGALANEWEAIWNWVDQSRSSSPTYHACSYFLDNLSSVPSGSEGFLWSKVLEVFDAERGNDASPDRVSQWKLRSEVSRHYLQYLEVRLPGVTGDGFAGVAFWLTEKVMALVGRDPSTIERFRNIGTVPQAFRSEFAWRVANPIPNHAPLALAIHGLVNVWALSILRKLTPSTLSMLKAGIAEEKREAFERAFTNLFLRGFPLRPTSLSSDVAYAFEGPVEPVIAAWVGEYGESERMKFIKAVNVLHQKLFEPMAFAEEFRTLCNEKSEADQILIANCAVVLAKQGTLPLEPVWACLSDAEWRNGVFKKLPDTVLEMLFIAFAATLTRGGKHWVTELPHYYAKACEDLLDDQDRADLFFGLTLLACVHTYSVSALERLLRGKRAADLAPYVNKWRRVFIDNATDNAPWVAARSRALLAALNVT